MKKTTLVVSLLGGAGLAMVALNWYRSRPLPVSHRTHKVREADVVAIPGPAPLLQEETPIPIPEQLSQVTPSTVASGTENTPSRDGVAELETETAEEFSEKIEAEFGADPPPDANAIRTERNVRSAFRGLAAEGARLGTVDCRQTRCRLSVDFASRESDNRVLNDLFTLLSKSGVETTGLGFLVSTRDIRSDGSSSATVHLFKVATH